MSVEVFLDTNVLIYAVSSSPQEAAKKERALDLIEGEDFGLSAQVLQEFYVNVTRNIARPLPSDIAVDLLEQFRQFPLALTDYPLIVAGVETSLRYGISYRDGAIVAAAAALGARTLFSEDLNHGQVYGDVRVVNPFLAGGTNEVHDEETTPYGES